MSRGRGDGTFCFARLRGTENNAMGYPAVRIFIKFEILHEVFTATPSLIDERSSSRSDNWHSESEQRSRGCFGEGGCAARRLHAYRVDRFWRNRFPYSVQGVNRTRARQDHGAETRCRRTKASREAIGVGGRDASEQPRGN